MNSLVELFSDVDDFCQVFQPSWENQQLASGLKQRRRGQLCLSEMDDPHAFPSVELSHLQSVLQRICSSSSAISLSRSGQLCTFRVTEAEGTGSAVRLLVQSI